MVLGTLGVLFWLDARLAMVGVMLVAGLAIYARQIIPRMWSEFRIVRERKASLSNVLEENLAGIQVIKAFAGESRESDAVADENRKHYESRMSVIKWISLLFPGSMLINGFAVATIGLYGGTLVMLGELTLGTFTAFLFLCQRFLRPIMRAMMMAEQAGRFFAGIERFFDYMDIEPDIRDRSDAQTLKDVHGDIRFDNVHFSYDDPLPVLENICLEARPGQMVALVGPSGAGKTTVLRLIPRFYEIDGGRILIDGKDIRDIRLRSLRAHIAIVMQEDFLFSDSVTQNIAYGRPGADMEDIVEAARLANAHDFIEGLPDGYYTEIGKRGLKLSGGQRQRISIARALLKNPQFLLLDEATSSVDSETERLIQEAVERLRQGRTTFVIAHRLSTILNADKILFVNEGRIEERGTHRQLIDADGQYARFYRIQYGEKAS